MHDLIQNNDELISTDNNEVVGIIKDLDPAKLPSIIKEQIKQMEDLVHLKDELTNKAEKSMDAATDAANAKTGFGHKKAAIESLQDATMQFAETQSITIDALKTSFDNQEKLSEITKYLFSLGVYSVANARIVIQQLAEELEKDGKKERLSDVSRQQIQSVINQLQSQEKIMEKQENIDLELDEHRFLLEDIENQLDEVEKVDKKQTEGIEGNKEKLHEHEIVLSEQQKKDAEHDEKFEENDARDSAQDEKISVLKNDLVTYKLQAQNQIDNIYSKITDDKAEINKLIEDYETNNKKEIEELTRRIELLESTTKKKGWKIAVSIGAGISLILNLLQIFEII